MARIRTRTRITAVGTAFVTANVQNAPLRGFIRRVRATVAIGVDAQAAVGALPAADIALEIREAAAAVGMGGAADTAVVLAYGLTPTALDTSIDSHEDIAYRLPVGGNLVVAVRVNAQPIGEPDAIAVVTIDIEPAE